MSQGRKKMDKWILQLKKREFTLFSLHGPFCSIWVLDRLDDVHLFTQSIDKY